MSEIDPATISGILRNLVEDVGHLDESYRYTNLEGTLAVEKLADRLDPAGPPRVGDLVEYEGSRGIVVHKFAGTAAMFHFAFGHVQILPNGALHVIARAAYDTEAPEEQ